MFGPLNYIFDDELLINPIDLQTERRPASTRLYTQAKRKAEKLEENSQRQEIEKALKEISSTTRNPKISKRSKMINIRTGKQYDKKSFYEYSLDWKLRKDKRVENEKIAKEKYEKAKKELEYQELLDERDKRHQQAIRNIRKREKSINKNCGEKLKKKFVRKNVEEEEYSKFFQFL